MHLQASNAMFRKLQFLAITLSMVLLSCVATEKMTNKFSLTVIMKNKTPRSYSKFMIAGAGPPPTRLFIEDLNTALQNELIKSNIDTDFQFLGTEKLEVISSFKKLRPLLNEEALFLILPVSIANVTENQDDFGVLQSRSIKLEQDITLRIYDKNSADTCLWKAEMDMNINFTNTKIYKKIASHIIEHLKAGKVIN